MSMGRGIRVFACLIAFVGSAIADDLAGRQAMEAYQYCLTEASKHCNVYTIYCDNYRRSFVKSCMISIGIDPDYIKLLLEN